MSKMVDPASGSVRPHQPALSITVTPLSVDTMGSVLDEDGLPAISPMSPQMEDSVCEAVFHDLVDEVFLGVVFEVHRAAKLGLLTLFEDGVGDQSDADFDETTRSSVGVSALEEDTNDRFSSSQGKKPAECICPNCQRNMAASRFAPHLEKCMGMGRNSSRLASRRIATATREAAMASEDDGEDDEWGGGGGGASNDKRRRNKKDKNSPRRKKMRNGESSALAAAAGMGGAAEIAAQGDVSGMELLPVSERRTLFSSMCGVVSEHTGKMCTKTLRCPQHTETQRREVRDLMLAEPETQADTADKDRDIDVDTWEEGDSLASLLTAQAAQTAEASPAESTSTSTSSTSSKKTAKQNKAKKKTRDGL